ncbi:unnamed protein product [Rotaria sordida]|uniref:Uncharacterized protein n=1 Tax=Rotaria sordida TaxID=392033 RepID=A0A815KZ03_9BILA|nr:unnamed protein product [Rotaria sordida]
MVSTITIIFLYLVITTINRFTFEVTVDIYQLLYQYGSQLQSTPYIGQCFQQGAHNIGLREQPHQIGHIHLPDFELDQIYDFRIDGPYDPRNGHRYDIHDSSSDKDLKFSTLDSAPYIPKKQSFMNYIKKIRETCSAIAHPVTIAYFKKLGITSVELILIQHFVTDRHIELQEQVLEFKRMVKKLHKAGIDVSLDVTYNYTGEGNQFGPTLLLKGIDNGSYYRLIEHDKRYYFDYTGCDNTLNCRLPNVLRLIMNSLRYSILDMHVDGFRFDLAVTFARELHAVDRLKTFFDIIHQDSVIGRVKLFVEP